MTATEPNPTAEHIDAVALVIESAWSDGDDAKIAHRILTSTDPAVHAAMLDALVRAGVLVRTTITANNATVSILAERIEVAP
jgi:hypothetical protein